MGPNGGSVATDSELHYNVKTLHGKMESVLGSEFLKAVISEHGRFFIMFLKRDKSCN